MALREHRLDDDGLNAGMEVHAGGADDAVPRPGVPVVGVLGEVVAGVDVVVLRRDDVGVVVLDGKQLGDPRATSAPPATAREPPSQKSFCTSTTISARIC